jgi:hypothetical protein
MEQIETTVGKNETASLGVHAVADNGHFLRIDDPPLVHASENRIRTDIAQHLARRLE